MSLQQALTEHMQVTENHVKRLEQIATQLGNAQTAKSAWGWRDCWRKAKKSSKEGAESPVLDAALIGAAQKVEHYEIAGYGTARAHACTR